MRFQALTTLLVLVGALAAPAVRAQQPPAGSFGLEVFTAGVSTSPQLDSLMAIDLNGVNNPFPQGSVSTALAVNIPLNTPQLNGTATNLVAARSQQRRGVQAPREAELAPVFNAGNPFPAIFIPAEDPVTGLGYVTSVDCRGGFPFPTKNTTPIPLNGGSGVPYEILRNSTQPFVYYTTIDLAGNLVVVEVNYSTIGAPVVTATYTVGGPPPGVGGPPARYATRLTEVNPTTLAIPWAGGVDIVSMPGLNLVSVNLTPVGFTVRTNVAKGWKGFYGYDLICGLEAASTVGPAQHGYLAMNSITVGGSSFSTINPFGNVPNTNTPWILAAGFYEIAITPGPGQAATATFLLDSPLGIGTSTNTQVVTVTQTQFFATTVHTIAQGSPFGNPEVMANPQGSVAFMVSAATGATDFVGAIWPSIPGLTTTSVVVPMTGFVDPATVDRPLSLPGGNEFAVNSSVPFSSQGVELYSVGLGTLVRTAFVNTTSSATGLPNVVTGGLLGNQPVCLQGFTALDVAVAGAPFAPAPVAVSAATPLTASIAVTGGLVPFPPLTQPPTFGARQAMFNFANGQTTNVRLLYPGTLGGGSQIDVFSPGALGQWRHPLGLLLTSELFSF